MPDRIPTLPDSAPTPQPARRYVELAHIRLDGGTQPRCAIDEAAVAEYADAIKDDVSFPPVVVFSDGATKWLADGFHRFHATRRAGYPTIQAEIHIGTLRDAILYGLGANSHHGLRETRADKRRKIETLLRDDEWMRWSNREIARHCGVTDKTVGAVRAELSGRAEIPHISERTDSVGRQQPANKAPATQGQGAEIPHHETRIDADGVVQSATKTPIPATPVKGADGGEIPHDARALGAPVARSDAGQADHQEIRTDSVGRQQPADEATVPQVSDTVTLATADRAAPGVPSPLAEPGEIERLRAEVAELSANLADTFADNESMARVFEADDRIAAALAEAKKYRELNRVLDERIRGLMNEKKEAIRSAKSWKAKLEKLEREVKKAANDSIDPAVGF